MKNQLPTFIRAGFASCSYLKLDGFSEFSVFVLAGLDHFGDLLVELISVDFRHIRRSETKKLSFVNLSLQIEPKMRQTF